MNRVVYSAMFAGQQPLPGGASLPLPLLLLLQQASQPNQGRGPSPNLKKHKKIKKYYILFYFYLILKCSPPVHCVNFKSYFFIIIVFAKKMIYLRLTLIPWNMLHFLCEFLALVLCSKNIWVLRKMLPCFPSYLHYKDKMLAGSKIGEGRGREPRSLQPILRQPLPPPYREQPHC